MKRIVFIVIAIAGILLFAGCPNGTTPTTYMVTMSLSGAATGESVSADVSEAAEGATVTLTASLNSGRQVALSASGVTISPSTITSDGGTATFTMPAAAVEIAAMFSNRAEESGFIGTPTIKDTGTVSLDSESLTMIYANDSSSISFPTETDDSGEATLTTKFWIAETEVTSAVMVEVLQWAYDNSRFNATVGDPNGLDTTTAKHGGQQLLHLEDSNCHVVFDGSGTFTAESGYENNPVTNISWYGAVMFCNWLTEMCDGNTDNVVYTDIDTDWVDDETTENSSRNGYRLPSSDEWEYAARYRGADSTNTVSGYSTPYYTKGNSASGAYTYYNDESDVNPANGVVDGKDANDEVAVYGYYEDGGWISTGTSNEAEVKSLGTGSANALGLYDMSGNVWEWCFTESDSNRILCGGFWNNHAYVMQIGD